MTGSSIWMRYPSSTVSANEDDAPVSDGNAFFNRPGPRLVESLEIMAACVHPDVFADFAEKHATAIVSMSAA